MNAFKRIFIMVIVLSGLNHNLIAGYCTNGCEGNFREGYDCLMATDGDWETAAVPDAYNDSCAVIECYEIPTGIESAKWHFKVLRNNINIEIRLFCWDYIAENWTEFYEVPYSLDYFTYTVDIPADGLTSGQLCIKIQIKNASAMSGMYFEGLIDWIYPEGSPNYECEGIFRAEHECYKAVDGDWTTSAVPDAYGDSVSIMEHYNVPSGIDGAIWHFKVLRNTADISIRAYFWNYILNDWDLIYDVPIVHGWPTYIVEIPVEGLLSSILKTKILVKNASSPLMSGEYCEGAIDWLSNELVPCSIPFDIKPGSCPNALNLNLPYAEVTGEMEDVAGSSSAKVVPSGVLNRKPVIPAAILGTDEFDVYNINIATITLEGVAPDRWSYEDVATPVDETAAECECNDYGPDGYLDLALKFDKADIVEIIGEVVPGQVVPLTITGELNDGIPFEGVDCVVIVGNASEEPGYDGDYVALVGTGLPTEFALFQNRPNPFNPITALSLNLPNPCNVILTVYDILGRRIETLADGHFEAGNHTIEWDGSRYASGIYFYRLEAGDFVETRKMTLLK